MGEFARLTKGNRSASIEAHRPGGAPSHRLSEKERSDGKHSCAQISYGCLGGLEFLEALDGISAHGARDRRRLLTRLWRPRWVNLQGPLDTDPRGAVVAAQPRSRDWSQRKQRLLQSRV